MNRGLDVFALKNLLDHQSLALTVRYYACALDIFRPEYQRCHPLCTLRSIDHTVREPLLPTATPTPAEILQLMAAATNPRDQLVVRAFYASGLRRAELTNLLFADVDHQQLTLFVRNGKGGKDRYVLIDKETSSAILALRGSKPLQARVFGVTTSQSLARIVRLLARRTGLEQLYAARGLNLCAHSLRHAFATHCFRAGISLQALRTLLGHVFLSTTRIYVQPDFAHAQQCYAQVNSQALQQADSPPRALRRNKRLARLDRLDEQGEPDPDSDLNVQQQRITEWTDELGLEVARLTLNQLPLLLSPAEANELIRTANDPLEQAAWSTLYHAGLRESELLALTSPQVQPDRLVLLDRHVALDSATLAQLQQLPGLHLFPLTAQELRARLYRAAQPLGILPRFEASDRQLHPSAFRHAYAAHQLAAGMDLFTLQDLLGHRRVETTELYLRSGAPALRAAYDQAQTDSWMPGRTPSPERSQNEDLSDELRILTATLQPEEVHSLFEGATGLRDQLIILLFYTTGIRINELVNLRFADIDPTQRRLFVRDGKDHKDNYTFLDPTTLAALQLWQADAPLQRSVFQLGLTRVWTIVKQAARRANLLDPYTAQGLTVAPHSLRKSFATHRYQRGLPIHALQQLLAHANLGITEHYVNCPFSYWNGRYQAALNGQTSRSAAAELQTWKGLAGTGQ